MARQKEFDREAALDRAMAAFWSKGYAATSIEDLLAHMGIQRGSLYGTFGDKRTLFLAPSTAISVVAASSSRRSRRPAPIEAIAGSSGSGWKGRWTGAGLPAA
jgi:hypothetical protein